MKYKYSCEVTFPVYEVTVNVNIPINKSVHYVCLMFEKMIIEEIDPSYQPREDSILVDKVTGQMIDRNLMVKVSGINNGSKLTYF